MNQVLLIFRHEWEKFRCGEAGQYVMYVVMILCWSALLGMNASMGMDTLSTMWWLFFSVIITATFSATLFVAELVQGALEIVLTCGVSRRAILYGKILFCVTLSTIMGYACFGLSLVWQAMTTSMFDGPTVTVSSLTIAIYISSAFFNTVFGAWLTLKLSSPRILYLVNIMAVAVH